MAPNEETDLSKVTQSLIHTECSVVLIWSQGLRNYRFLPVYTQGIAEFWKIQIKKCQDKNLFYLGEKLSILEKIACILYTVFEYIKLSYLSIHQNTLQKYK